MKLELFYTPTTDLDASLRLYRDVLGFEEVWREGESTVSLTLPGAQTQLMLDAVAEPTPAGPMLVVDSVSDFHRTRDEGWQVLMEPMEIPDGFLATYQDPGGTTLYVLDQSAA